MSRRSVPLVLLVLALGACKWHEKTDTGETGGETAVPPAPVIPHVVWGDLHNHTNLSYDGCEDPDDHCLPDETLPAADTFPRALASGLGFAAITDHAEFVRYERPADDVDLDIWEHTADLVRAAEGTGVVGVMGYEWTSNCSGQDEGYAPMHRTVLVEDVDACAEWRVPSCRNSGRAQYAAEYYTYSTLDPAIHPSDLMTRLEAVPSLEGCAESRTIGFFHHTAQTRPASVDWGDPETFIPEDTVVEIASEHGSSECDTRVAPPEDCAWRMSADFHTDTGSVQYALQMGHKLGFVGGTDNHMDDPGKVLDGPGRVRDLDEPDGEQPWHDQFTEGTLTGALVTTEDFDRSTLFDILEARHTVVASWAAQNLVVYADGADGERYLPGDDIPTAAEPLAVTITLDDPLVTSWDVQIVDAYGAISTERRFTIPPGEARYIRVRAWIGEDEHRIWASPFFAE